MMGRGETNSMITVFVPRNKAVEWRSSENRITIRFLRFSVTISTFFFYLEYAGYLLMPVLLGLHEAY